MDREADWSAHPPQQGGTDLMGPRFARLVSTHATAGWTDLVGPGARLASEENLKDDRPIFETTVRARGGCVELLASTLTVRKKTARRALADAASGA